MKLTRIVVMGAIIGAATPAHAFDLLEFLNLKPRPAATVDHRLGRSGVATLIAQRVSERLGSRWVPTALRIAKIESGGRCDAYNRGAIGVFQVRHPERFGVSSRAARTCAGGVEAGVAHMRSCLDRGATTPRSMMICHNTGTPFGRRVEPAYRRLLASLG